jgi:phosphatidylglycerophosphate synthase
MTVANLITLSRFPLLVFILMLLYWGGRAGQLAGAPLIILLMAMDSFDGLAARRRNEATLVGAALDIAADRAVEIVFWVSYAHLGLIPVFVPLTFVIRGALTDSVRSVALQHGYSAHSMMRSRLGRWLVAGSLVRTVYALVKAAAFVLLALTLGLRTAEGDARRGLWTLSLVLTWVSVMFCLLRGIPVLVEAPRLFRSVEFLPAPREASAPAERAGIQD